MPAPSAPPIAPPAASPVTNAPTPVPTVIPVVAACHGFVVADENAATLTIVNYTQVPVERRRGRPAGFSAVDLAGVITVTDPAAFLAKLPLGFGSAKAFGNGLMLIRRA